MVLVQYFIVHITAFFLFTVSFSVGVSIISWFYKFYNTCSKRTNYLLVSLKIFTISCWTFTTSWFSNTIMTLQ